MASRYVTVRVLDGEDVIEEVRRPVRLTPEGFAGVVYSAAVFPLRVDESIDISGASWEIEDCNRFLISEASIPYAPVGPDDIGIGAATAFAGLPGGWALDSTSYGHNVVFNASERTASTVVDALERGGLPVQRWDVSHRPALDGRFYDWFARLRSRGSHDEVLVRVGQILAPRADEAPPPAPVTSPLDELQARVESLVDLTNHLQERVREQRTEIADLRALLATAGEREAKLGEDLDRSLDHQKGLQQQLSALRGESSRSDEVSGILSQLVDTEELLETALAENTEMRGELLIRLEQARGQDDAVLILETTVAELRERLDELSDLERERRRALATRVAPRRGVAGFLETAFKRIVFVLDSIDTIADLETPAAILRNLVDIDRGELVGKDLEGLRGWREVSKLATGIAGREDMGRIYYRPDGGQVLVSVHVKRDDKEQRRHIDKLRPL